jgi:hypothetical protein
MNLKNAIFQIAPLHVACCLASFVMLSCGGGGNGHEDAVDTPADEIREEADVADVDAQDTPAETHPEWDGIHCGGGICSDPQVCCFEYPYYYTNARCADPSDCGGHVMACDGAEDCDSGETCCVTDPSYPASACQTASCDRVICHIDEQCAPPRLCCPHPFIEDNFISYCTTVAGTDCPEY